MTGQATTTDQPTGSPAGRRTRRQLLAGGTGALAAVLAAEALAQPAPASADNGNPVILGSVNTATSETIISNSTAGDIALHVTAQGSGRGVFGGSIDGIGVLGVSNTSDGVSGGSVFAGNGVSGASDSGNGVLGSSRIGNGVYGQSGATASTVTAGTGVSGITDSSSGAGVLGENASAGGVGMSGTATGSSGTGVTGNGGSIGVRGTGGNIGVLGSAGNAGGTGVYGNADFAASAGVLASNTAGGNALLVSGTAAFSRSGILTVAAGKSSATQTGVALTAASLVLATLQQHVAGMYVVAAVPNITGSSFTVYLSKAPSGATKVAWFVVN